MQSIISDVAFLSPHLCFAHLYKYLLKCFSKISKLLKHTNIKLNAIRIESKGRQKSSICTKMMGILFGTFLSEKDQWDGKATRNFHKGWLSLKIWMKKKSDSFFSFRSCPFSKRNWNKGTLLLSIEYRWWMHILRGWRVESVDN